MHIPSVMGRHTYLETLSCCVASSFCSCVLCIFLVLWAGIHTSKRCLAVLHLRSAVVCCAYSLIDCVHICKQLFARLCGRLCGHAGSQVLSRRTTDVGSSSETSHTAGEPVGNELAN